MRRTTRRAAEGLALAGGLVLLRPGTRANRIVRRSVDRAGRRLRYAGGRLQGMSYRVQGRQPEPDVIDTVLADRIRSSLGALERQLDVPHVHVMVDDHVAMLHGEVGSDADAQRIEAAVAAVSGVDAVESFLHIGLGPGDTRPSAGRSVRRPSAALRTLLDAAGSSGIGEPLRGPVVRAVLGTFAERLPDRAREQVAGHLPADVQALFAPPRRSRPEAPARTVHELVARITATESGLPPDSAEQVTRAVIDAFRSIVPDETHDVAAVLPGELRDLWVGHLAS